MTKKSSENKFTKSYEFMLLVVVLALVVILAAATGGKSVQVANIVDGVPVKGTGAYYFEGCRTGLVETCDFVAMLEEMGVKTGIDPAKLIAAEKMLEKILGRPLDSFTAKLG